MKKNKIIVTGGAGFVGTNLINFLLKKTKFKIISIDNYSSGFKKNHIKNKRVTYLRGDTRNISSILKNSKNMNEILKTLSKIEKVYFNSSLFLDSILGSFTLLSENELCLLFDLFSANTPFILKPVHKNFIPISLQTSFISLKPVGYPFAIEAFS